MSDEAIITNTAAPEPAAPAITEQQAQTMPLDQLKAMITGEQPTQATAPTQQPDQSAQAAPPSPEWGQIQKNAEGRYEVKLASGEVFKGTADEVIAKQAEAQYNTKRWAQQIRDQYEKFRQNPEQPVTMPAEPQQLTPDEQAAAIQQRMETERQYLAQLVTPEMAQQLVAQALGVTPEALPNVISQVWTNNAEFAHQKAYFDFLQACPEFNDTPENAAALVDAMPQFPQGYIPTGQDMQRAWAIALYEGKGKPTPKVNVPPPPPMPPLMPSAGSAGRAPEQDPYSMPLDQLKKLAGL